MSGSSSITFVTDDESYYKIYNIREELLFVTPYLQNANDFIEELLEEKVITLPHCKVGERVCYRGHVYIERVLL